MPEVVGEAEGVVVVDHLVFASPDLDLGIDAVERLLGVRAAAGGSHPQWGTRNALLALGADVYLEIIAPDPALPRPASGYAFGIDALEGPALVTWAMKSRDIDAACEHAREKGYDPGRAIAGSRALPDGGTLQWRLTMPRLDVGDGLIPFLIDWGDSPHPAASLPCGGVLRGLAGKHPNPARVSGALKALGAPMRVTRGRAPRLMATIETGDRLVALV